MLLDNPVSTIKTYPVPNPSTLLPTETGPLEHDCIDTRDTMYSSHPDLGSEPLPNAEEEWFTDERSFMRGKKAGGIHSNLPVPVIEGGSLPPGTSPPNAKLTALTRALEIGTEKILNVYTDSRYVYAMLYALGAIWKERGMLIVKNKQVKHGLNILKLLEAVQLLKKVAVSHCRAHQRGMQR